METTERPASHGGRSLQVSFVNTRQKWSRQTLSCRATKARGGLRQAKRKSLNAQLESPIQIVLEILDSLQTNR